MVNTSAQQGVVSANACFIVLVSTAQFINPPLIIRRSATSIHLLVAQGNDILPFWVASASLKQETGLTPTASATSIASDVTQEVVEKAGEFADGFAQRGFEARVELMAEAHDHDDDLVWIGDLGGAELAHWRVPGYAKPASCRS